MIVYDDCSQSIITFRTPRTPDLLSKTFNFSHFRWRRRRKYWRRFCINWGIINFFLPKIFIRDLQICIAKNYKYTPHPFLFNFFFKLIRNKIRTPTSQFIEPHNRICIKCYEAGKPFNYESRLLHGFLGGNLTSCKCNICKTEIVEMRSILQCDDYFRSYVQFTVDFRKHNFNDIALLFCTTSNHTKSYIFLFVMRKFNSLLSNYRNWISANIKF